MVHWIGGVAVGVDVAVAVVRVPPVVESRRVPWIKPNRVIVVLNRPFGVALNARGDTFLQKGDYDRAIQDFDQAIRLKPGNATYWNSRCRVRALAGQLDSALADCNESLRLRPSNARTAAVEGSCI